MHRTSEQNGAALIPSAQSILDALTGSIAVLDPTGTIIAVNQGWLDFGRANHASGPFATGVNYLHVCERASGADAACAKAAAAGIRSVLAGQNTFSLEYPCHSPDQHRWFQLRVSRLEHAGATYAVVVHHDITDRMLVEQERQGLLARAHQHQERLKTVAAASTRIAAAGLPDAAFQEVTDQARQILGAHLAATQTVPYALWPRASVVVSASEKCREVPMSFLARVGAHVQARVLQSGLPLRLTMAELNAHPDWRQCRELSPDRPTLSGLLAVPLIGQQSSAIGVVMLFDKERGEFTPDDEAILVQLAQIASVSIENAARSKMQKETWERLRATQEHAAIGIGETDATGRYVVVNRGLCTITGYSHAELLSLTLFDLTHHEDAETERALYERQVAGNMKTYALEKRFIRKNGSIAWLSISSTAVFDDNGRYQYSVRVVQDIDQRKQYEQRQSLLVRELHHRVRNTLAVVQALAGATARSTTSMREFSRSFSNRITALAKTQSLLTEDYWQTASLRGMLLSELEPFRDRKRQRFKLEGPDVELSADLAIPLSMALHELTANAARYGALSVRTGCVSVNWAVLTVSGSRELHFQWIEQNGPPAAEPSHSGFGMVLFQQVLPRQCRARVRLEFGQVGFQFEMEAPLIEHRFVPGY